MDTMGMHVEDLVQTPRTINEEPADREPRSKRSARSKRAAVTELDYRKQRERLLERARAVKDHPSADPHAAWIVEYWEAMDTSGDAREAADKIRFSIPKSDRDNPDVLRSSGYAEADAKASALDDVCNDLHDKIIRTAPRTHDGLALQLGFIIVANDGCEFNDEARGRLTRIAYDLLDDRRQAITTDRSLLSLWEEIKADAKSFNDNPPDDDKEFERVSDAISRKEKRMSQMSPKTATGALALMELFKKLEGEPFGHIYSDDIWSRLSAYLEKQAAAERTGSALHHFYKNLAAYKQRSAADQAPCWMGLPDPDRPEPILELVRQMNDFMVLCHRSEYAEEIQKDYWAESRAKEANTLGLDAHRDLLMAALRRAAQTPEGALAQVCLLESALDIVEIWDDKRVIEDTNKSIRVALHSIVNALERLIGVTREEVTFHSNFLSRVHDPFNLPSFDQLPDDARATYGIKETVKQGKSGRRRKSPPAASSAVATTRAA